jgi:hypothetical protein
MQKSKAGWVKVGVVTALLCVCFGVAYGVEIMKQEEDAAYKRALEFNFSKHYQRVFSKGL